MIRTAALAFALLSSAGNADTLVYNVNGIQVGADGKIQRFGGLVMGDDGKVERLIQRTEELTRPIEHEIDGGGRTLLPGLIDAHGHVMGLGLGLISLDVTGTKSLAELQHRLRGYAAANPGNGWIVGRGWNQELWPTKSFPTAADLDAVVSDRPVVLERVDGHAIVANSAALRIGEVDGRTMDVAGGKIERDAKGTPTGLLVDNAMGLVLNRVPASDQRAGALAKAQNLLLSFGLTSVADMGVSADEWAVMQDFAQAQRLNVRIMAYSSGLEPLARVAPNGPTEWLFGDHLKLAGVKLYEDGALGSRGAWLKQSYADKPDTRGLPRHNDSELMAMLDRAAAAGFPVAVHAIGDEAIAHVIAAYERLSRQYGRDRRWRIEHFQIADPKDIGRLAPAGIIASMQPTHQTSDRLMAEARLGPNRLAGAYAWHSVLKSGARLAFGSDFPVESPNPFPGLAAAVSRQDMERQPAGGWLPAERVSFAQALSGFTRDAAYAGFAEDRIGSLEPGKWADFILVDRDPTKVDAQALARTQVLETWVAGKKVWARPSAGGGGERGK
ncbi:MAG TPA: amidohydrolase family protein [Sphingomicrobium sp.]|nr:amidohydrolase family protein [Sphingomicrobium sp.]